MNDFDREQEQRRQAEATRRQEEMTKARREQAAALEKQRLERKNQAHAAEQARQARHREASAKLALDERERFKTLEARASAFEKLVVAANKGQESRTLDPRGQTHSFRPIIDRSSNGHKIAMRNHHDDRLFHQPGEPIHDCYPALSNHGGLRLGAEPEPQRSGRPQSIAF